MEGVGALPAKAWKDVSQRGRHVTAKSESRCDHLLTGWR